MGADLVKRDKVDKQAVRAWMDHLKIVLPNIEERKFFRRAMGYCLYGGNPERLAYWFFGGTSTGKSTTLIALLKAFGSLGGSFNPNNVFNEKALNPELANHLQRRLIGASEAGGQRLNGEIFKKFLGRDDTIPVERKHSNEIIEAIPQAVPIIASNSAPTFTGGGEDEGAMKRIMVIPFDVRIPDKADDKHRGHDLVENCLPVIMWWLLDGWADYVENGLNRDEWPAVIRQATDLFNQGLSDIGDFLSETCEVVSRDELNKNSKLLGIAWPDKWKELEQKHLFAFYKQWCETNNMKALGSNTLTRRLNKMGYKLYPKKNDEGTTAKVWLGIRLTKENKKLRLVGS